MTHVATLTIDHTKVAADLTDFPVLVIANGDAGWDELYALATEGGGDIRCFKSDGTTELPREIVSFTVSGEAGEIHIKYSGTLSSTVDTDIQIHCDGTSGDYSVSATYGRNNVWTGYTCVYHTEDLTTDSTGNYNLTNYGTTTTGTGKFGNSADFGTANTTKSLRQQTNNMGINGGNLTLQAWAKMRATITGTGTCWRLVEQSTAGVDVQNTLAYFKTAGGYEARINRGKSGVSDNWAVYSTGDLGTTNWNFFVGSYDGTTSRIYFNANTPGTNTTSGNGVGPIDSGFAIASTFHGFERASAYIDEVRCTSAVLSANWITTDYNNQNSPSTFYSVVAESSATPQALTAGADVASTIATKKTLKRTLSAPTGVTASITLKKTFKRTLSALADAGATITSANLRFLSLTASIRTSALMTDEVVNARLLATNLAVGATIAVKKTFKRTLTASTSVAGTIATRKFKLVVLTASIRTSASIQTIRTYYQTLTASVRTSSTITRGNIMRTVVLSAILSVKGSLGEYFYKQKYQKDDEDYKRKY